jgi:hypothetical protein
MMDCGLAARGQSTRLQSIGHPLAVVMPKPIG